MPIEIEARLLQRAVYFAGETIHCEVTISHRQDSTKRESNSPDDNASRPLKSNHTDSFCNIKDETTLAWASAQIYCQCHINETRIVPWNNTKGHAFSSPEMQTSFIPTRGETGHCLLSTKPTILFCNQKIQQGQTRKFIYTEKIPENAPPSYRGQSVRFSYKITFGFGSINGPTKLIRLPIRVLSIEDGWMNGQTSNYTSIGENPFFEDTKIEDHSIVDVYLDRLTYSSSQRNMNVYNISCSQGSAGKFSLSKASYRIGEDVQGSFDFTDATVRCIKYKVSLQSEESIKEEFQKKDVKHKTANTSYSRCEECCLNNRQTNFSLPIPITSTPEFTSKIVSLRWRIHCEFTTSTPITDGSKTATEVAQEPETLKQSNPNQTLEQNLDREIPRNMKVETMTWDVPVKIVATNPIQVSLMSCPLLTVSDIL